MADEDVFYESAKGGTTVQYTSGLFLDAVIEPHPNHPTRVIYTVVLPQYLDNHIDDNVMVTHKDAKALSTRRYTLLLPGDFCEDNLHEVVQIGMDHGVWTVGRFVKSRKKVYRGDRAVRGAHEDRPLPPLKTSFDAVRAELEAGGWAPASRVTYRTRRSIETPASIHFVEDEFVFKGPPGFAEQMEDPEDGWIDALKRPTVLHGDWDRAQGRFYVHVVETVCPRAMDLSPRRIYVDPEDVAKQIANCPAWVKPAPWAGKTAKNVCPTDPDAAPPTCQPGLMMVPTSYRYKLLGATYPVRWMHEYEALAYRPIPPPAT